MAPVRIAVVGAGFWSRFQLAGWRELAGVELAAVCDRRLDAARALAAGLGIPAYDDPATMLRDVQPDAVDVITPETTHRPLAELALEHGAAVVCQKPLAPTLADAEAMIDAAARAGRPLLVNENFRWQAPIRALKAVLDGGEIGAPFRARLQFSSAFPVFDNQPALRESERFILLDVGSHLLDVARMLFGEADRVLCDTASVTPGIRGEDVATVVLRQGAVHTAVELSYASRLADARFPETLAVVEGSDGSAELRPGCELVVTTRAGTRRRTVESPRFDWADPAYGVVHASIVPCQADLLAELRGERTAETTGADNLRTLRLVMAAYASAASGDIVRP